MPRRKIPSNAALVKTRHLKRGVRTVHPDRISPKDVPKLVWRRMRRPLKSNIGLKRSQSLVFGRVAEFENAVTVQIQEKLRQKEKRIDNTPLVVVLGGPGGGGKTTSAKRIQAHFARSLRIDMAEYSKKEPGAYGFSPAPKYRRTKENLPGQAYNPRSVDWRALLSAVDALKRGKKAKVRAVAMDMHTSTGVPKMQLREVDGSKIEVIFVDGVLAADPRLGKRADLRAHVLMVPGLQDLRTVERNIRQWNKTNTSAETRLRAVTRNITGGRYRRGFVDSRVVKDADLLLIPDLSKQDLAGMSPETRAKMQRMQGTFADALVKRGKRKAA